VRRLSFTDHVALSKLFHPILRFNTTDCAHPSRDKTTLFLLQSEVDGFLLFRSISPTEGVATRWSCGKSMPFAAVPHMGIGANPVTTDSERRFCPRKTW
jgi:hypothetical protein